MKKKLLSLTLAAIMVAGMPLTVSAGALGAGDTTVSTEGEVGYVNKDVFSVTLPTTDCFNFIVDPQGILYALDGPTHANYPDTRFPEGTTAGYIVESEGTGAYVENQSSVPIKLTVDACVVKDNSAAVGDESSVNLLSSEQAGLVNSGIDNNMWLTLDITHDGVDYATVTTGPSMIKTENVNQNVFAITKNGSTDGTNVVSGSTISLALNKAEYEFTGTSATQAAFTIKSGARGDCVGMRLSGRVNTNADWSAYTGASAEQIIVKTVFGFEKLSRDYEIAGLDGRAHGALSDIDPTYSPAGLIDTDNDEIPDSPAPFTMDYTVDSGAIEIPFDLGYGTKEVSVTGITAAGNPISKADYKVNNNVITLKITQSDVKGVIDTEKTAATAAPGTGVTTPLAVVITTSDTKTTTVTINTWYI